MLRRWTFFLVLLLGTTYQAFGRPMCDSSECLNGGTCMDITGEKKCYCLAGFGGDRCEIDLDDCRNNECFPGSKCVDKLRGYSCECSEDRFGNFCQFENQCTKDRNKCVHGQCYVDYSDGSSTCECVKGYTGDFCEIDIDECAADPSPCYRGKCTNTPGSYQCDCELGYKGKNCDISIDECESRPCLHGGTCIDLAGDYKCICMPSWHGKRCEQPKPYSPACDSLICLHGGYCEKTHSGEEYCKCPSRFYGKTCESLKRMDDAKNVLKCPFEAFCIEQYGNGVCNPQCNSAACGWDGGDCSVKKEELSDDLVLTLITDPATFIDIIAPKLLMTVSQLLHLSARYQLDANGNPMVYEWSSLTGQGPQINLLSTQNNHTHRIGKRSADKKGVIVYLKLDVSVCRQLSTINNVLQVETMAKKGNEHCFTEVQSAVDMMKAETTKAVFKRELGASMYEAQVKPRKQKQSSSLYGFIIGIIVIASLVLISFTVVVSNARDVKRKYITVKSVFFPPSPGDLNNNRKRRHSSGSSHDRRLLLGQNYDGTYGSSSFLLEPPPKRQRGIFTLLHQYASSTEPITTECLTALAGCAPVTDEDGKTCIHWSIESLKKDDEVIADIRKLVSIGCPLTSQDNTGANALHLAIRMNRTAVALYLIDQMNVNVQDDQGRTPLFDAVCCKLLAVVKKLLTKDGIDVNVVAETNDTALHKCSRMGDEMVPFVTLLLSHPDIKVDMISEMGALEFKGTTALHEAASSNSVEIIKLLVEKGASLISQDSNQDIPLHYAVQSNNYDAVELLVYLMSQVNADISFPNNCDITPLHEAQLRRYPRIEALLLEATNFSKNLY